jgi:hypothetical protein
MHLFRGLLVMAGLCVVPCLCAQGPPPLGARLRVWFRDDIGFAAGVFSGSTPDSLTLRSHPPAVLMRIAWTDVRKVDQFWGIRGNGLEGGILGAVLVGFAGVLKGQDGIGEIKPAQASMMLGVTGAVAGGLIGGLVGSLIESEVWRPVPIPHARRLPDRHAPP